MNILAHLYLSGKNENIIIGNFIGDFVKGNQINKYQEDIARGIKLHRAIDHFTDKHDHVKKVNTYYRNKFGKHSGIVTDIIFDHFLSNNWKLFSDIEYNKFIRSIYKILNNNLKIFPYQVIEFYPFVVINNWLKLYHTTEGIEKVLKGMSSRTSLPGEHEYAITQMKQYYNEINHLFIEFFFEIIDYVNNEFQIGLSPPQKNYL